MRGGPREAGQEEVLVHKSDPRARGSSPPRRAAQCGTGNREETAATPSDRPGYANPAPAHGFRRQVCTDTSRLMHTPVRHERQDNQRIAVPARRKVHHMSVRCIRPRPARLSACFSTATARSVAACRLQFSTPGRPGHPRPRLPVDSARSPDQSPSRSPRGGDGTPSWRAPSVPGSTRPLSG